MILTIALLVLKLLGEDKWRYLAEGASELFGVSISVPTFVAYILLIAIALDLCTIILGNGSNLYVLVGVEGMIIYNWSLLYKNLLSGIHEIIGREVTLYGFIVLWICITIAYFVSDAMGKK